MKNDLVRILGSTSIRQESTHGEIPANIVVIMADFLGALALPMYGNTTVKAPHFQRLGENGVVFENAYCNMPLCGPSRASFLTGLLPSKVGVYDNGSELPAGVPTFAHYLRLAGYRTCLTGKMHFVGPDQLHGFEERLTTDVVRLISAGARSRVAGTKNWTTSIRPIPTLTQFSSPDLTSEVWASTMTTTSPSPPSTKSMNWRGKRRNSPSC